MADYETEIVRVVWNNKHGTKITVSPDADSLGLVQVQGGDSISPLILTPEEARLVAAAMAVCADEVEEAQGES